jgi:AraC-like DNA-binding protein
MFNNSSKTDANAPDPVSEMLRGLRLEGVEYGRCRMIAPWGLRLPAQAAARFHFIAHAGCWLQAPDKSWMKLNAGDAVLVPRGGEHILASEPGVPPVAIEDHEVKAVCDNVYDVRCARDGACGTTLFCGSMTFNLDSLHPLLQMMPEVMRTCELASKEPSFAWLLDAMNREVEMDRVGAAGILARLADVLAAGIIRSWVEFGCGDASGWIAAVRCKDVGKVLAAIHLNPERDWNLATLAGIMGASRSSFAEKFTAAVGETPARYVARIRMFQARQWIARDNVKLAVVAHRLGYDSEASFSRAFKRIIGHAPSHFRAS